MKLDKSATPEDLRLRSGRTWKCRFQEQFYLSDTNPLFVFATNLWGYYGIAREFIAPKISQMCRVL